MSDTIRLEINKRTLSIEIGKIAKQADGSALVRYGDTIMLVTATSRREIEERQGLPAPHRRLPGEHLRRGQDPGRLLQARGPPVGARDPGRPPDRPARPAALPRGLLLRHPDRRPAPLGRPRERARHARRHRRLGRPLFLRHPLHDAPRRGQGRPGRRRFVVNPTAKELEASPLNLTVVGTEDGIIMIEGGAKEADEEKDPRRPRRGPRGQPEDHPGPERALRPASPSRSGRSPPGRGRRGRSAAHRGRGRAGRCARPCRSRASSPARRPWPPSATPTWRPSPRRRPRSGSEAKALIDKIEEKLFRELHHQGPQADRRPGVRRHPADLDRGRPAAPDPRLGPLHPGRDAVPGHGHPGHRRGRPAPRHARAKRRARSSCSTTTSRRSPSARSASSAPPAAARSATARWPRNPSCRPCRTTTSSPTRSASSPTSWSPTAPPRWPRSAAASWPSWTPACR